MQFAPNATVLSPLSHEGGDVRHAAPDGSAGCTALCVDDEVSVPRDSLLRLCSAALNAGVARDEVARCLARAGPRRAQGLGAAPTPSQPIALYTLGRFALVRHGEPLAFHGKSPHKPIELLQALVALGGRDVHTELLMAAVWPGDESVDLRNLFDNTLHRLRHVLECDDALLLSHAKLTLNAEHCWVDAWAFDRLAGIDEQAAAAPSAALATRLYNGHFLALEAPRPWVHPYRERLRSRFLRLVAREGARLEDADRWSDAAICYDRGIEIDPLAESLYRQLMACHLRRGAQAEALQAYARCRIQLHQALGVAPSAATVAVLHAARPVRRTQPPSLTRDL